MSKNTVWRDEGRFISAVLAGSLSKRLLDQSDFIKPNSFLVNPWNGSNLLVLKS